MTVKDWHKKPPTNVRSVADALGDAERQRRELPEVVQVYARDWDKVILADEVKRLRETLEVVRLATCDYTVGTRANLAAAHKLVTDALKAPNIPGKGRA